MKVLGCVVVLLSAVACGTAPDPESRLDAWATAAIAGDYVTAWEYMLDPNLLFLIWQDQTERGRRETNRSATPCWPRSSADKQPASGSG